MARSWETPTATLTVLGLSFVGLYATGHSWALWPAAACLALPGVGGTAITIYNHVVNAAEEWTWRGIVRAFRKEKSHKRLWGGLMTHLPQLALAVLLLALGFRSRGKECRR